LNNNNVFKRLKPLITVRYSIYKYLYRFFYRPKIWHTTYQLTDIVPFDKKVKTLLTIHDLNFLVERDENGIHADLKRMQQNIDYADEIVAISNYVKNDIIKHCSLGIKRFMSSITAAMSTKNL
jgi:hypothetical protein